MLELAATFTALGLVVTLGEVAYCSPSGSNNPFWRTP